MTSLGVSGAGVSATSRSIVVSPKCGWCSAAHETKECPVRRAPTHPAASTSISEPPPPPDSSRWKCPRCLQPGVNVWHGYAQRRAQPSDVAAAVASPPPPPPPPTQPVPPASSPSPSDPALRKAVASLQARVLALEERFASLDTRMEGLVAAHTATASKISSLVDAQQVVISSITTLTERMDSIATRLDKLCELLPSSGQAASRLTSSSTLRSSPYKHRVRH